MAWHLPSSLAFVATLAALLTSSTAFAARIVSFDPPNSDDTYANALNGSGAVVGFFDIRLGNQHAFLRTPNGTITVFDASPHEHRWCIPFAPAVYRAFSDPAARESPAFVQSGIRSSGTACLAGCAALFALLGSPGGCAASVLPAAACPTIYLGNSLRLLRRDEGFLFVS